MSRGLGTKNFDILDIEKRILKLQSKDPKWSIVICAHNEEKYILDTIYSISRLKTDLPLEIIAINNSSQDRTKEILETTGIHVFDEKEKWISFARRKSVEVSKGEIIFQTDADTIVPKDWINLHLAHYISNPDVVWVHWEAYFDRVHKLFYLQKIWVITTIKLLQLLWRGPSERVVWANMSFKRDLALEVWNYNIWQNYLEDVGLFKKMSSQGIIVNDRWIRVLTSWRRYSTIDSILKTILDRKKSSLDNWNKGIIDFR